MKEFTYIITDPVGIHARPAGLLAKEASKYNSRITIEANGKIADATRLMSVMSLGVKSGTQVNIKSEGADEDEAIVAIKEFMESNL